MAQPTTWPVILFIVSLSNRTVTRSDTMKTRPNTGYSILLTIFSKVKRALSSYTRRTIEQLGKQICAHVWLGCTEFPANCTPRPWGLALECYKYLLQACKISAEDLKVPALIGWLEFYFLSVESRSPPWASSLRVCLREYRENGRHFPALAGRWSVHDDTKGLPKFFQQSNMLFELELHAKQVVSFVLCFYPFGIIAC